MLAAAQRDVKRMLAYSAVAHAGFILAGLTSANTTGIRAAMFYLIAYAVMTVGAFGVTMLVATKTAEPSSYDSYDGLAARSPGLAALMTVFLLSLAGIPPTVGFIAKLTRVRLGDRRGQLAAGARLRAGQRGRRVRLPAGDRADVLPRAARRR